MKTVAFICVFTLIGSICCQTVAADLVIEMLQIRKDVVVASSGTVDTDSLQFAQFSDTFAGAVKPAADFVYFSNALVTIGGPGEFGPNPLVEIYTNANSAPASGPSSFGFGTTFSLPDTGSGDVHGVIANGSSFSNLPAAIAVPVGYVSGEFLSSEMTFRNTSFAELGVTEGIYTWSFDGNEVTLVIVVPPGLPPMLGDCNQDGEVTFADIPTFIEILSSGGFLMEADCNEDCQVDFADISSFIVILTAG